MKSTKSIAIFLATILVGVSAAPTNEISNREEFAINNKRELEARCSPTRFMDYRAFHQECDPGFCECIGKFGCWKYWGDHIFMCQCRPDGPFSC